VNERDEAPLLSREPPGAPLGISGPVRKDKGLLMELAKALARIGDLQDEAGRTTFVHAIGAALGGHPLLVRTQANPQLFLFNVVEACDERPGGLDALLLAVDFVAPGTPSASLIRRLVSPAKEILPPNDEERIRHLLVGRTVRSLARLYHVAAGRTVAPPPGKFADAWQVFSLLLDANAGPDGLPPHLVFVELLAGVLDARGSGAASRNREADVAGQLRQWVTAQAATLRAEGGVESTDRLFRIRSQSGMLSGQLDFPMYLVIQLEPVTDLEARTRDLHRISHWRQIDPFEWRPERGEDHLVSLAEAPSLVADLIQEAERDWAYPHDDSLILEFVLPAQLINIDVDQWARDPDEPFPAPIGTEYEVVVRSHDRLRERAWHRAWRRRWNLLTQDGRQSVTHWVPADRPSDLRRLRAELAARDEVVCCVLSCPPDREPGQAELRVALRAGLPVVVWHRDGRSGIALRDSIREVIERSDIRTLPQEIKRFRMEANLADDSTTGAGGKITLLWDDPDHFLDTMEPLRPPSR
jgi:hypothetical protein